MADKESFYIAEVLQAKSGAFYIKAKTDVSLTLKEGDALFLEKPEEGINRLVEKGYITAEEAKERLAKVPDFVRFYVKRPKA